MRLFFALWPSPARREALATATAAVVAQVDGLTVPQANFHVTLAFLGMVPSGGFADLVAIGGEGGYPAVALDFDRLEYWVKPKVVVAMASRTPPEGLVLVDRLWGRIEPLGFQREERPWQPHLTLVRRVRRPPPELNFETERLPSGGDPDDWGLTLVESSSHPTGVRYRPLAEWPLG